MNLSHYPVYTVEHQVTRQSRNQFTEKPGKHSVFSGGKEKKGENPALLNGKLSVFLPPLQGGGRGRERAANLYSTKASLL